MMTDIWCFTCSHEIRRELAGGYTHLDPDDLDGCPCAEDGEACAP
jgi:hypothetical protein